MAQLQEVPLSKQTNSTTFSLPDRECYINTEKALYIGYTCLGSGELSEQRVAVSDAALSHF